MRVKLFATVGTVLLLMAGVTAVYADKCDCDKTWSTSTPTDAIVQKDGVYVASSVLTDVLMCDSSEQIADETSCVNDNLVPTWYSESYADADGTEYIVGSATYDNYTASCSSAY